MTMFPSFLSHSIRTTLQIDTLIPSLEQSKENHIKIDLNSSRHSSSRNSSSCHRESFEAIAPLTDRNKDLATFSLETLKDFTDFVAD